jgi:olefin beta-lactone synthetase
MAVDPQSYLPFPSRFFTFEGSRIHYLDTHPEAKAFEMPTVVLLHGNPTWCYYYRNILSELHSRFRLIAIDYRGCGLSERNHRRPLRFRDRVDEVKALIESLGLGSFSLVMHDWGGPIGSAVAVELNPRVVSLTYLNTTLTEIHELPWFIRLSRAPLVGKLLTSTTGAFLWMLTRWGVAHPLPKEIRRGYLIPYRQMKDRLAIEDFVADIPFYSDHPSHSELADLRRDLTLLQEKPVQIIWGLQDPCFHQKMLRCVAACFPRAQVLQVPEASHLVLEDAPQVVITAIESFLCDAYQTKKGDMGEILRDRVLTGVPIGDRIYSLVRRYAHDHPTQQLFVQARKGEDGFELLASTFGELDQQINRNRRGLRQLGLKAGERVLFLLPVGLEFLALAFAVMEEGAIPVFVDPGVGIANLKRCFEDAQCTGLIASPKALILKTLTSQYFQHLSFQVIVGERNSTLTSGYHFLRRQLSSPLPQGEGSDTAMIAFTSGATGVPKGVVFTHGMLSQQVKLYEEELEVGSGDLNMPLLPIFCLYNAAAGVTSVLPEFNPSKPLTLDPKHVAEVVCRLGVTSATGSPTLWGKVAHYCKQQSYSLTGLQRLFLIGAPVQESTITALNDVLTSGECFTPYGATEALPLTVPRGQDRLRHKGTYARTGEEGVFVGKPVAQTVIRVVEKTDSVIAHEHELKDLPSFVIGEIVVAGPQVSPQYFAREEATERAKVKGDHFVWHRMGDMGYLDDSGNLYFCGRAAHVVTRNQRTYYSVPAEIVFNRDKRVQRSALVSLQSPEDVGIVIEPKPEFFPRTVQEREQFVDSLCVLAAGHPATQGIVNFFFHPSLPVDGRHNAKIFRCRLGRWASKLKDQRQEPTTIELDKLHVDRSNASLFTHENIS